MIVQVVVNPTTIWSRPCPPFFRFPSVAVIYRFDCNGSMRAFLQVPFSVLYIQAWL